jgi:hypothetical protein
VFLSFSIDSALSVTEFTKLENTTILLNGDASSFLISDESKYFLNDRNKRGL